MLKPSSVKVLLVYSFLVICLGSWLTRNLLLPEDPGISLAVKVVSKLEQAHYKQHKHYTETDGIDNYLRIYNKQYGYADLLVTTNTYMTSNVNDIIYFTFSKPKMNSLFGTNFEYDLFIDSHDGPWLIFFIITIIACIWIAIIECNDEIKK